MDLGVYLRRDCDDYDAFFLEVVDSSKGVNIWTYLHIDAIGDLFGNKALQNARSFKPGERRKVHLEMSEPATATKYAEGEIV